MTPSIEKLLLAFTLIFNHGFGLGAEAVEKPDASPVHAENKPETIKSMALGTTKVVPSIKLKEVQQDLVKRLATDQGVRKNPAQQKDMGKVDAENTEFVLGVLKEYGWIDVQRFGLESSNTAFLIVQHSGNLALMLAVLPEIEKDLKDGRLRDGQNFALLYDRVKIFQGEKQRYGTQIGPDKKGNMVVLPLEDRTKVEQYRKEIGVFPLSEYMAMFEKMGGKKVTFSEE